MNGRRNSMVRTSWGKRLLGIFEDTPPIPLEWSRISLAMVFAVPRTPVWERLISSAVVSGADGLAGFGQRLSGLEVPQRLSV